MIQELYNNLEILKIIKNIEKKKKLGYRLVIILNVMQGCFDIIFLTVAIPVIYGISGVKTKVEFLEKFSEYKISEIYSIFVGVSVIYLAIKILTIYKNNRYSYSVGEKFAKEMIDGFCESKYSILNSVTQSDLLANYIKIGNITTGSIQAILQLIGAISTALILVCAVIYIGNVGTYLFVLMIVLIYAITANVSTVAVKKNSSIISNSHTVRNKILLALYKIKPESFFYPILGKLKTEYEQKTKKYIRAQIINNVVGVIPRHIIEVFFYVLVVSYIYFENVDQDSVMKLVLSLMLMLKILPSVQTIYQSSNSIKATSQLIKDHFELIEKFEKQHFNIENTDISGEIIINNPIVRHEKGGKKIEIKINEKISIGEFVLFKGPSGLGKSTLIKVIAGLIDSEMKVNVESFESIYCNTSFQKKISYLPQRVSLINGSILDNILMGDTYDDKRLYEAINVAKVNEFIEVSDLNEKEITDENTSFSGGQMQRICLARALYKKPEILLIDEGLNGVDLNMERGILENIRKQYKNITLIAVSHNENIDDLFDRVIYFT